MNLDERFENVSVIGAAGKMGSGIAVLIAQEMAKLKQKNKDKIYRLNLIDVSEQALDGLSGYMKAQIITVAEKSIVFLREMYEDRKDLVENIEIINAFVDDTFSVIRCGTELGMAKSSKLIFEAIAENEDIKIKVLKSIDEVCGKETFFLTNTSSIPIGFLDKEAGLDGRIIGYHFYNPPIVQKLVEVITPRTIQKELSDIALELGKRLRKKLVPANDVAGFIGNGHFTRDGLYALNEIERLKDNYSLAGAIYIMNRISQDFLIRPMGIFQLIDYVGIDVFDSILKVMRKHLGDETLRHSLVNSMIEQKVLGGQRPDGSQKDGFLKYEKNRPVGIYDAEKKEYVPINKDLDTKIGALPAEFRPWKALVTEPKKQERLSDYFASLKGTKTLGAELALSYLTETKKIGEDLVKQSVANSADDVNSVLTNGFYWVYGPINEYI